MIVRIVQIGNSEFIRIPRHVLEQCDIAEIANLRFEGNRLVLTQAKAKPRQGWAAAAKRAREAGDDVLLIPDVFPEDDWEGHRV